MPMFLVTPLASNFEKLLAEISAVYEPEEFYLLANNAGFLIRDKGTSVEVSNKIGITSETPRTGSAMVTNFTSYYGRGNTDMWEWLKSRFEGAV